MPQKPHQLMTRVKYAETLVGKALAFNQGDAKSRKVRSALLVTAIRELQAETIEEAAIIPDQLKQIQSTC